MAEFWIEGSASLGELAYEGEAEVHATLDWQDVDHGIGEYEYWGSKGVHHDWKEELQQVTILSAVLVHPETGDDYEIDLADPANRPLVEYWKEYILSENE